MKAKAAIFFKLRKLSFSETLVKNETVMRKHWPQPSIAARVGEGPLVDSAFQIGNLVVLVHLHRYSFSSFKVVILGSGVSVTNLAFLFCFRCNG